MLIEILMNTQSTLSSQKNALSINQLSPNIGALVQGIDVTQPLADHTQQWLEQALLTHQVLFFRNQAINPNQQAAFAQQFGALHIHPIFPQAENQPEIVILDNHQTDLRDNAIWHTDVTFIETPPLGSVLAAKKVPAFGGDTLWSSSYAAFEALSPSFQTLLEGLTATHNIIQSFPRERFGHTPEAFQKWQQAQIDNPCVIHPVIRTHPVTGKKLLFVNEGFTTKINELSDSESKAILSFLFQHITQPEFTIRWQWQADDIAFWDNRATQHYATNDYGSNTHRVMHRATINGDKPF